MIDGGDRTDIGNPFPWLTYGLNLGAEWKGFDVQLFFQGVYGNKIYNQVLNRTEGKGVEATLSTSCVMYGQKIIRMALSQIRIQVLTIQYQIDL